MKAEFFWIDAFTRRAFGGNPAAVIPLEAWIPDELMQSVAYPEGWFYVERAVIIMFGLAAQLAPKLNTFQIGFPYVMRLMAARQAEEAAKSAEAAKKAAEAAAAEEAAAAQKLPRPASLSGSHAVVSPPTTASA